MGPRKVPGAGCLFRAGWDVVEHVFFCASFTRYTHTNRNNTCIIMATQNDRLVQVYLFFNGRCEEAVEFYRKALGAEVEMMMRFKESPEPPPPGQVPPGFENKIMHCSFRVGNTTVMASDGCSAEKPTFQGFALSVAVPNQADANRVFTALAEGGQVKMPLTRTFWSPSFGMLEDRFGIGWMVSIPGHEGQK